MIEFERRLHIRKLAAKFLLSQPTLSHVVDVRDCMLPKNIVIASFESYSKIAGVPVSDLTCNGALSDGYTIKSGENNIILYNESYDLTCPQRLRFSLAHELGHVFLKHEDDNAENEAEANYFASEVVAHDALVASMLSGIWEIDLERVRNYFGVSWETADIKLRNVNRNKKAYFYEEIQLFQRFKTNDRLIEYKKNKFSICNELLYIDYS